MTTEYNQARNVLFIFLILHAIAFFILPLLPFIDLPNHLAEATIFKYHEMPGNQIAQYYQPVPWYFPNTFHTVFCSLFPDVEIGNKVFHVITIVLLGVSVFLVIKKLGGNPWYGLLALLFTYNYNLTYGFVGFAISIPMLLLLFYLILVDLDAERVSTKVAISLLLVVLFLAHAQNALLGLLLYGVMMLYVFRKAPLKLLARVLTVPIPFIIILFTWWMFRDKQNEGSTLDYLMQYYKSNYFTEFPMRFRIMVFDNFQLQEGIPGIVIAVIVFLTAFAPLVWFKVWKRFSPSMFSVNTLLAIVFFLAVAGCYFLLPDKLPGQTPLFQRFTTIVILMAIVCGSIFLKDVGSSALKIFAIVSLVIYSGLWLEYLYSFNQQNKNFDKTFFSGVSNSSRMAALIYDNTYRGRKVYIHYPNYFIVWNQGISASKIIDYRFGVVRRVAMTNGLPFYNELIGDGYRQLDIYNDLDYLLVRGNAPNQPDENLKAFTLEKTLDNWKLYKHIKDEEE